MDGCDVSETALKIARETGERRRRRGEFYNADALAGPLPGADGNRYDAAVSSLFLHHLSLTKTPPARCGTWRTRRSAWSSPTSAAPGSAWRWRTLACRTLSRSPVVRADGPQSVRAAFTIPEFREIADAAGLTGGELKPVWPQRFLFVRRRDR